MGNEKDIKKFWQKKEFWKRVGITLLVGAVLFGAWVTFLWIVKEPPLETIPSMIMVWISFLIVILALFPELLDKIKRVKFKDFELELQESVTKATSLDYISISEGPDYHLSDKADFRNLAELFLLAKQNPEKPILLRVNIRNNRYISIPALFIYLYFLDLYNSNIVCLFFSSRDRIGKRKDIEKDEVIGVVEGKKVFQVLLSRFPRLIRMVTQNELSLPEESDLFNTDRLSNFFRIMYEERRRQDFDNYEFLSQNDVRNYFMSYLNEEEINYEISKEDEKSVLSAIIKKEKYLIVYKGNKLYSIVPLELISNDISKKVLQDILKEKDDK